MKNLIALALAATLSFVLLAQEEKKPEPPAAAAGDELVVKGKEVFEEQCSVCHSADTEDKKVGPSLKGLYKKEKLKNGKPANEESVALIIKEGGNGMPAYEDVLEKDQKTQVMAYLKTL